MKRIFLAGLLCFLCTAVWAQVPGEEPFRGGSGDGHALTEDVAPFAQPNAFSPFRGGAGDGHSLIEDVTPLPQANAFSPFRGGTGDGYDGEGDPNNIILAQANNFSPFIGGAGDGYDIEDDPGNIIMPQAVAFGPFLGGVADGHAGLLIPNVIVLPLELLSFEGRAVEAGNLLFWKTEKEDGLAHFRLERSADGRAFSRLTEVRAKGLSGRTDYNYTDTQPFSGHNYYRLKMEDADGSHTYSNIVLLIREGAAGPSLVLFPNPAREAIRLQHERLPEGTIGRVIDARGSVIWQSSIVAASGAVELPVDRWTPGSYVLHLAAPNGWREEVRFVKQ